jgi:hypothetical protein
VLQTNTRTGTNTFANLNYSINDAIIEKEYSGFLQPKDINILIRDFIWLKDIIEKSGVNVPKTISINIDTYPYGKNNFTKLKIVEDYCGNSLKDLILQNTNIKHIGTLIKDIKNLITQLPENIEIDTNPGNFTMLNNKIYFVDFMPAKIWEYQTNKRIIEFFPQIKTKRLDKELRRIKRYNTNVGRLQRFNYYLDIITSNTQNPQPQQTTKTN